MGQGQRAPQTARHLAELLPVSDTPDSTEEDVGGEPSCAPLLAP